MKLAEALLLRAQMQQKLQSLQSRILANLRVQEGETIQEDPEALLSESMKVSSELGKIIKRINACNNTTTLPDGRTLAEALADRDILTREFALLSAIANAAMDRSTRVTRSELVSKLTLSIPDIQRQMDDTARKRRELDVLIQSINWATEM